MYDKAINFYVGREVVSGSDYLIQDDGNGIYIKYWNIQDIQPPSISQIDEIINNISFAINFDSIRTVITQAQIEKQKESILLANKFVLDCSDETLDLINKAKQALIGSGRTETRLIDYQGNPSDITLDDIDVILGNPSKNIIGEIPIRRLDLHEQEIALLEKVLLSQPYEIIFN